MTTIEDVLEQRRIPEPSEVRAILDTYFVGPITDEIVAKLHDMVARVLADPALRGGEARGSEPGNGGLGFGRAWREELSYGRMYPRSIDLTAFIAWSHTGYPPAPPYCPDAFAGRWIQREPKTSEPVVWVLEGDGRFSAPGTPFADRITWCVHRQGVRPDEASVWLEDKLRIAEKRLLVRRITPTELHLSPTSDPDVHLERP